MGKSITYLASSLFLLVASGSMASTTYYSIASGSYTTSGNWSTTACGGASCGCTPGSDIVICSGTTITFTGSFTVGPGGNVNSLTVNAGGTFITTADLTFKNGSTVTVAAGGKITVGGNFANNNNSTSITINGGLSVSGNANFGNGSTVTGSGSVSVGGSSSGGGTVYGGSPGCSNCTLAITLSSFTAAYNNNAVSLTWISATETNNKYYTIERSDDGVNYSLVANVNGAGNSTSPTDYSTTDESPNSGLNYYRLSQTDFDGNKTILGILPVAVNISVDGLKVFPNPANNNCVVSFNDKKEESFQLSVYDYMGREMLKRTLQTAIGINSTELDISGLSPGLYFVALPANGHVLNTKFIKN
jgi:hypothetical protein